MLALVHAEIKLIDFGLSEFFSPFEPMHELVGTPLYWAPECFHQNYGKEADIWAIGIILYEHTPRTSTHPSTRAQRCGAHARSQVRAAER